MKNKTGWYIRVSTDDQKNSLDRYREKAKQFCDYYNHELIDIYSDNDVSGGIDLFKRPEGKRMYQDLLSGKIDTIASPDMSRFFRDLRDGLNTLHEMQELNIKVYVSNLYGEAFDLNTIMGFSMIVDQLKYAQIERMNVSIRTKDTMTYRRRNSMATSHAPYGKDKIVDTTTKNKMLVTNEKEMSVVESIKKLYDKGWTYNSIANKLIELGVPSKRNGVWYGVTVKKILHFHYPELKNKALPQEPCHT